MVKAGLFEPRLDLSPEDITMVSVSLCQEVEGFGNMPKKFWPEGLGVRGLEMEKEGRDYPSS